MFIIDDILKLPVDLGMKALRAIADQIDDEMLNTEASVRKKVMETQLRYEGGALTEEEYREMMDRLSKRLKEVKE